MAIAQEIVAVNDYALLASPAEFALAVAALARRVEAEGHPGVLAYRFFIGGDATARGIVRYADAAAWIGHHEIAFGWPEMTALHHVARLQRISLHGPVTPEIREWLGRSRLTAAIAVYDFAAGFRRA